MSVSGHRWVVGLLGLLLVAGVAGCRSTGEPVQGSAIDARPVTDDGLAQTVEPVGDGFSRVTVWTATFAHDSVEGVLRVRVIGAGEQREALVDAAQLGDNEPVTFVFPPIEDSGGEPFTLVFTYDGPDRVGLWANPHDPYPAGSLDPGPGDLSFELGHASRMGGALDALRRVPGEIADRATRDPWFLTAWVLGLVALTAAAVLAGRRRAHDTGRGTRAGDDTPR